MILALEYHEDGIWVPVCWGEFNSYAEGLNQTAMVVQDLDLDWNNVRVKKLDASEVPMDNVAKCTCGCPVRLVSGANEVYCEDCDKYLKRKEIHEH